jgi:hypothetical protein
VKKFNNRRQTRQWELKEDGFGEVMDTEVIGDILTTAGDILTTAGDILITDMAIIGDLIVL